jgi:hypothetical protein
MDFPTFQAELRRIGGSGRGCVRPARCGFGSEWPSGGGPIRGADGQGWCRLTALRVVRSGGHLRDIAEMEQQLCVRGFVDVETCLIPPTTFVIAMRP